jgi:hypothetical protein
VARACWHESEHRRQAPAGLERRTKPVLVCAATASYTEPFRSSAIGQKQTYIFQGDLIHADTRLASPVEAMVTPNGCLAGTLIHTNNGLIAIEEVRVGDWLLSQPEAKVGVARAFKQVLEVFTFAEHAVLLFRCYKPDSGSIEQFIVTPNYAFWIVGLGWTRADQIDMGREVELADGTVATTLCATPIYQTAEVGIGWVTGAWGAEANNGAGNLVDLRNGSIVVGTEDTFNSDYLDDQGRYAPFSGRIFNVNVDACHTYFVGTDGVWVRGLWK